MIDDLFKKLIDELIELRAAVESPLPTGATAS